jgi:hypothetical protein
MLRFVILLLITAISHPIVLAHAGQKRDMMGIRLSMTRAEVESIIRDRGWICQPPTVPREMLCATDFGNISFTTVSGDTQKRVYGVMLEYTLSSLLAQRELADSLSKQFSKQATKANERHKAPRDDLLDGRQAGH